MFKIMEKSALQAPRIFIIVNLILIFLTSKVLSIDAMLRYQILLVQYLIVASTLFILVTRSIYNKVAATWPKRSLVGLTIRFLIGPIFVLGQSLMLLHLILASTEPKRLSFVTGYSFGFTMFVVGSIIVVEAVFSTFLFLSKVRTDGVIQSLYNATRRNDKQDRILITITFILSCMCFYIAANNCAFPEVVRTRVPIKGLPNSLNNTVIVQLSDLHIGVLNGEKALSKVVKVTNALKPDIVAITGDTAEGATNRIKQALLPLKDLKSKYGVFITTGNHDYYTADIDRLLDLWKDFGLTVLHNSNIIIKKDQNDVLNVVGVDDSEGNFFRGEHHGPFYDKALKDRNANIPTILLSHRPTIAKKAMMKYGNIQLALCGHTHGGQFPISGFYHYFSESYFSGLYKFNHWSYVYVSTGVFYWAAPLRLMHKGQISHITLISA